MAAKKRHKDKSAMKAYSQFIAAARAKGWHLSESTLNQFVAEMRSMKNLTLQDLSKLNYLLRWQNVPCILKESVAEHTCQVCLILMKLSTESEACFDLSRALKLAVLHDALEGSLTDIPHNVTRRFPVLAQAKREAEAQAAAELLPEWHDYFKELEQCCTAEAIAVKLCDTLQVAQFCCSELSISRSKEVQCVLAEASSLAIAYSERLPQTKASVDVMLASIVEVLK